MRSSLLLALLILLVSDSNSIFAADPAKEPELRWQTPFTRQSGDDPTNRLVLILVTNDDAFLDHSQGAKAKQAENLAGKAAEMKPIDHSQHGWCALEFHHTCQQVLQTRPELKDRVSLQSILAGTPSELSGGNVSNSPPRVILLVCDGFYNLLALSVGIPSVDDLLTLFEDAQEVKTLLYLNDANRTQNIATLVQRSKKRLGRLWNLKLQEIVDIKEREDALIRDGAAEPASSLIRMHKLFSALQPTYTYDVQTRFGLSTELDGRRLVILEQHSEPRYPWCQAIAPFITGMDVRQDWRIVVELLWQQCAVASGSDQTDLLTWFDEQKKSGPFVMAIKSPSHLQHRTWPPTTAPKHRKGTSWQTAHDAATEFPFRTITPQQLTELVRQRELKPLTFFSPSMIRYLLVSPNNRLPQIIREQDLPARFWGLLRRAKPADKSALQPIPKEKIR